MQEELQALKENDTYDLITLPNGRNALAGRWVYTIKKGPDDDDRFKARYVAKGYSQVPELEYGKTFNPTARMTSIRMLLQIAVQENLVLHHLDIKTAYLSADIDCEIFLQLPECYK